MFVKTLADLKASGIEAIHCDGKLRTVDFLTKSDGMGFTVSDVRCSAGLDAVLWYKHHWEANYIVTGKGSVEDTSSGQVWPLEPGVTYTVGPKDRHRFRAHSDLHIVSIFNPPLIGTETYDEDGSLAPSGEVPAGPGTMFVKRLDELRAAGREMVVAGGSATTIRVLLQQDALGFSLSDVRMAAGSENVLWYKHHWEANYILHGQGEVSDRTTGERWAMEPGMMYIVGPRDQHSMQAHSDLHLVSIFNPPLRGNEQHDEQGTLPPSGPLPPGMSA